MTSLYKEPTEAMNNKVTENALDQRARRQQSVWKPRTYRFCEESYRQKGTYVIGASRDVNASAHIL
jgi:hypothetical protein